MGGYNGFMPEEMDPRRNLRVPYRPDDEEDGLMPGGGQPVTGDVPRGTIVPQFVPQAGNISADAGLPPKGNRVMQVQPETEEARPEDMFGLSPYFNGGVQGTQQNAAGSEQSAADRAGATQPPPGNLVGGPNDGLLPWLKDPADKPAKQPNPFLMVPAPLGGYDGLPPNAPPAAPAASTAPPAPDDPNVAAMQNASSRLAGLGPRPANVEGLPGQHHGFRKALDVLAGIGIGAYTANPLAGVNVYQHMRDAPLRKAQGEYDAQAGAAGGQFDRAKQISGVQTAQDRVDALQQKNAGLEQERNAKSAKLNETFVAGSEREDKKSPTGWVAETVGGETKPFTPKQQRNSKADDLRQTHQANEEEADRLGLKGDKREYFIANGKPREPGTSIHNHIPSEASEAFSEYKAAFRKENGRDMNAQEIFDYQHNTKRPPQAKDRAAFELHWSKQIGPGSAVERKYDAQRQAVLKSYGADKDPGQYGSNKADIDAKFAKIEADRETEKATLQKEKDAEADQYGIYDNKGGRQTAPPQTAPDAKNQPAAAETVTTKETNQKVSSQQVVNVNGQFHRVVRIENGVPILAREVVDRFGNPLKKK